MTCREDGTARVVASESETIHCGLRKNLDCFVATAPRNDEDGSLRTLASHHGLSLSHTRMLRPSRPSVKFLESADVMVSVSPSSL